MTRETPAHHPEGTVIADRYVVVDVLGHGGFAVTYRARDQRTGRLVALKELSLHTVERWKAIELFEREARVLRGLDHPGIPSYLDIVTPDEDTAAEATSFVLVQELAGGRSLAQELADGWRPDEDEVAAVARAVLEILVYLQTLTPPVIHRDIKPDNLIRDPGSGAIMLVDFGAVKATLASHSKLGTVVGTYGYMAPEQFQGMAEPASDLYALGATLIHLLAGTSPAEMPHHRLKIDFRPRVSVSPAFARWLDGMCEPSPEDRFRSARSALDALDAPRAMTPAATRLSRRHSPGGAIDIEATPGRMVIRVRDHLEDPAGTFAATVGLGFLSYIGTLAVRSRLSWAVLVPMVLIWGWLLARTLPALGTLATRTRLVLTSSTWHLTRKTLGVTRQRHSGELAGLSTVDADTLLQSRKTAVTLGDGRRSWVVSSGLDAKERRWLADQIRDFVERHRPS